MPKGRPPEHGMSHTTEHRAWSHMMDRCYKTHVDRYPNYGGRGISVCARWHDFANFLADMGYCPEGFSLDRSDNDGDYTPENCRWADVETQMNNTTRNVFFEWQGERLTVAQWARRLGVDYHTMYKRPVIDRQGFPAALRGRYQRIST